MAPKITVTTIKLKIAYFVSRLFDAAFWVLPLGAIAIFSSHFDNHNRLLRATGLLFFAGILPFAILIYWLKKGKISDIDFTNKEERTAYIKVILSFWTLALIFTWALSGPRLILVLLTSTIIIGALVLIINLYWKISNHALVVTIIGFLTNILYGWDYWWFFFFLPLVFWSRLVLKKHTFLQLVAGTLLGCLLFIILRLFGY